MALPFYYEIIEAQTHDWFVGNFSARNGHSDKCFTVKINAGSAWDPHTTSCIQQLEAVQRRAARFVTGDYRTTSSTSQMIQDLGWPPTATPRCQTCDDVLHHLWVSGHPSLQILTSCWDMHKSAQIPSTLLQNRCLPALLLLLGN